MKLNLFTITKKYWKEQIIFYFLTFLSCLLSFIIDQNAISGEWKIISKGKWTPNFKIFNWVVIKDFGKLSYFMLFMAVLVIIYCLIVIAHVYYAPYFANKISRNLRDKLMNKLFRLRNVAYDKKSALNAFNKDTERFVNMIVFVPNQLFYLVLSVIFGLILIKFENNKLIWAGLGYSLIIIATIIFIDKFLYKRDLKFQKASENQTKKENIAVNKRDLIIKKGLTSDFCQEYKKTVNYTWDKADKKEWTYTLSWVIPSFSLIPYSEFFFLPFVYKGGENAFLALRVFNKIFSGIKKMIERTRDYPYYFTAKKRLNDFLQLPERDDIQKNVVINETITQIQLKEVSFGYEKNKLVINELNLKFEKGKINYLSGENGFGKSTIINLLVGLYQPNKGHIIVNEKYNLNEINLLVWRQEKIAYAEHENLIENGLSTGQKQLADLNSLFASSENKEIFIFDEADNALDENNKKELQQRIDKIAKKKLVILISH
ncbi:ABC transporter ATP-binding protein/permease [endosymbiont GvMRE of Glomus versiforme]|uniref:ABC transporter ATP-binding protein/permease n=1 Tax=endosymbiont GvMRE of Glomus versiforme TaxID=2039283 RepID=UPI000ED5694D|nr:ABC transporter ATP-binding protein/permease [endosymbiont GvMRE of Glomus versiforme]RHZ35527.1 ABC transporter, ATP-binding protein [endosymbiont GvMRE of Glomus versiforme]